MGLLDSLLSGSQGGGLLDFLRNNAMNQQFSSGLPSDQAQYAGAPSSALAQMQPAMQPSIPQQPPPVIQAQPMQAQQAQPMQQAPQGPDFGTRAMAGLQGFSNENPGGLIQHLVNGIGSFAAGQRTDPAGIAQQQQQQQRTALFQALRAHNIDPQTSMAAALNPEVGNKLLGQLTDPGQFTSAGEGHALNNRTGAVSQLYEPQDKTPTSVLEYKFYKDSLGKGETPLSFQQWVNAKDAAGGLSLSPVYGKDANGNTVLLQTGKNGIAVQSKLPEGVTLNGVDNATLASDAARLNEGDDTVLKKYSNKGQGRVDLLRLNNEANRQRTENGQQPIDITQNRVALAGDMARERAAGNMEGRMAPAAVEAQGAFKIAREASENLARTNFVPYNKILQMGQAAFSNPQLKEAATAYNTAVMTYSRAIQPTGVGTVTAQEHARQILETADGPAATKAAFDQLSREVDMAHQAPGLARQYFADSRKARMEGGPPPPMPEYKPSAMPNSAATNQTKTGVSWSIVK